MKIVKCLEESGLLLESASKSVKNETKEQKGGFLDMLLGTLAASLLGNMLAGKAKIPAWGVIRASEGTFRAGQDF